ncbi:hypothetical protein AB0C77_12820 [Streptomyces sp. NPDC048629]|uniref:hypothetical protein n=1 Tax=Streptomyces sp. NPDC048629 TaxID=3154824 RepID=UPI003442345B
MSALRDLAVSATTLGYLAGFCVFMAAFMYLVPRLIGRNVDTSLVSPFLIAAAALAAGLGATYLF